MNLQTNEKTYTRTNSLELPISYVKVKIQIGSLQNRTLILLKPIFNFIIEHRYILCDILCRRRLTAGDERLSGLGSNTV